MDNQNNQKNRNKKSLNKIV